MDVDGLKRLAGQRAANLVRDGMKLGLGTGSTAVHFVARLGERVREGLQIVGVPTSEQTRVLAEREGIPLSTLDDLSELDLTVDGADELDDRLRLIKGGGGALLREKIVAAASKRMIVIADGSKRVKQLGAFPLPVEVVPFGLAATRQSMKNVLERLSVPYTSIELRRTLAGEPFLTDGGHYIIDIACGRIDSPEDLSAGLSVIPGVVEHGLFIGIATGAILATAQGLDELGAIGL